MADSFISLPVKRQSKEQVLAQLQTRRQADLRWQDGKVFSLVFSAGEEVLEVSKAAYAMFFSENMLNPTAFPSLRQCEAEVVAMSAALLGSTGQVVGNMTSGGTESILLAVLTAREWAKANKPEVLHPEMILPVTAHPAFEKAGHYFGVRPVHVPVDGNLQADVTAVSPSITPNTILIVGSAPAYPHGIIDPIAALAAIAQEQGILCHVDACVGGFMLPFVCKLGYPIPDFDFSVPGVTSLSADLHKYGYTAKGASVILYRSKEIRRHQLFAYTDWPGGVYASPTMGGTRPGGTVASAWAVMNVLGEEGYLEIAGQVMETAVTIQIGIQSIPNIHVLGSPAMSVLAIASDTLDIYEVGDEMSARGWHLDRQHFPPSLHLTVNFAHVGKAEAFLNDLAGAVQKAGKRDLRKSGNKLLLAGAQLLTKKLPAKWVSRLMKQASALLGSDDAGLPQRSAAMYGMIGTLPNRGDLKELVLDLVEQFTDVEKSRTAAD